MIRTIVAALSITAATVTGAGYAATHADAAPLPGIGYAEQINLRLFVVGATPLTDPVAEASRVCAVLRDNGKALALATVAEGYPDAFQRGYVLGTLVDVACPELVPVLR